MSVLYHIFQHPLPYARTLALQERIHQLQLLQRKTSSHPDILLLLQHRPVYTVGRRQNLSVQEERTRLTRLGADFETTLRGGETTYHGPGQIVGYPLLDLSRSTPVMGVREYVGRMQNTLERYLRSHGIEPFESEHTGVFLNKTTKLASIGVQVRHRLTSHGFSVNITDEPLAWFNQVVACGLDGVMAGSVDKTINREGLVTVETEMPELLRSFSVAFEREMIPLDIDSEGQIPEAIKSMHDESISLGRWPHSPM